MARREHSQRELQQKLSKKGYERQAIERVLAEFEENNWQSNERFAVSYFRSRVGSGFGPVRIAYELKERGVEVDIVALHERSDAPSWIDLLIELNAKKYGADEPTTMNERAKRSRFFQYKGYTSDMIRTLFNSIS